MILPFILPFVFLIISVSGTHDKPTRYFSHVRDRREPPPPVDQCNHTRRSNSPPPPPPPPPSEKKSPAVEEDCSLSSIVSESEQIVLQLTVKYLKLIRALDQKWHANIGLIDLPLNINVHTTCPYIRTLSNIKTLTEFLSDHTDGWAKKLLAV